MKHSSVSFAIVEKEPNSTNPVFSNSGLSEVPDSSNLVHFPDTKMIYISAKNIVDYIDADLGGRHELEFKFAGVEDGHSNYRNEEFGLIIQVREE